MNYIMTVTLPDGSEAECSITESILTTDNTFFNFKGREIKTNAPVTVRVETKENYDDRKSRGC